MDVFSRAGLTSHTRFLATLGPLLTNTWIQVSLLYFCSSEVAASSLPGGFTQVPTTARARIHGRSCSGCFSSNPLRCWTSSRLPCVTLPLASGGQVGWPPLLTHFCRHPTRRESVAVPSVDGRRPSRVTVLKCGHSARQSSRSVSASSCSCGPCRAGGAAGLVRSPLDWWLFFPRWTPTRTPLEAGCGTPRRRWCTPWSPCRKATTSPPSLS